MEPLSRLREQQFRALVDGWPEETAFYDRDGRCRYVNDAMAAAFGPAAALLGRTPAEAWPQSLHAPFLEARLKEAVGPDLPPPFEIGLGPAQKKRLAQLVPDDESGGAFLVARDLSERDHGVRTQERLNRAFRLLSACNQTLVHAVDEQKLLDDVCRLAVESGGYRMAWVGYAEFDAAKTIRPTAVAGIEREYLSRVKVTWGDDPHGQGPAGVAIRTGATAVVPYFLTEAATRPWREAAAARGYRSCVCLPLCENGRTFGVLVMYAEESDAFSSEEIRLLEEMAGDLAFGVATLRSRARREAAEARLAYLASRDPLTGLFNRLALREKFIQATEGGKPAALLFIDLDNFKQVNDSFDHATGDRLLVAVAERLCAEVGASRRDVGEKDAGEPEGGETAAVGRQGGDEFVVLLPGADLATARRTAERLLNAIAAPVALAQADGEVAVAAAIGAALYPCDGGDFAAVLKRADLALHCAKERGGGECRFYAPSMGAKAAARWRLFAALRNGLAHREFSLHYQPQVDLVSGLVVGAEALARWRPVRDDKFIPPSEFIPAAEQSGAIVALGEWALLEACAQAAAWRRDGVADLVMAVNVSAAQFRRADMTQTVLAALERSGLPPARLELELTESVLLDDMDAVRRTMAALKERGVRFSIDDFGSGYSSLSYLKRLAVDKLKIDQSFVRDLPPGDAAGEKREDGAREDEACAIVKAIIQLGAALGLTVVAEGVETAVQRDLLRRFGCRQGQGYLFARPTAADDFIAALQNIAAMAEGRNNLSP